MNPIEMYRTAKIMVNAMSRGMEQKLNGMIKDESGEAPVKALVMVFVVAILAGALLPVGITALKAGSANASANGWTAGEIATYGVITILLIVAVVLLIVRMATE